MLTYLIKKLSCIKHLLLLISFGLSLITYTNAQEIEWQNTIGGSTNDELHSIKQTADGGYILGGTSSSNISGDKTENSNGGNDYWIVKTDSTGNIQWQNTIGGSLDEYFYSLQQTTDEGYILFGNSNSNISGDKNEDCWNNSVDYWLVKIDALGNLQWQNTIGGNGYDQPSSMQQTTDGGYIVAGSSDSNMSGDKTENNIGSYDWWIVKTDSSGNLQWQNTIGGTNLDALASIQQMADGGYILLGSSNSNISGDKNENCWNNSADYWVVKIDSLGNLQWQNTIGGNGDDKPSSIQQTTDGGYILAGNSNSNMSGDKTENNYGGYDWWIIKTDSSGNLQWQNTIGGNGDDFLRSIQQTAEGGYILGGSSHSNISDDKTENSIGSSDYWMVKTDASGNIQWQNTIGGLNNDHIYYLQKTSDNNCIVGGSSKSNISGDKSENSNGFYDYWIIKLTDQYNLITGKTFIDLNSNSTQDIGEPSLTNKTITEQNTGRFAFSQQNGFYSVAVLDTGNFTVIPSPTSYYSSVPVSHGAAFTSINQTDSLNDFAFQPIGAFNDLCVTITSLNNLRQGRYANYLVNYENVGTTTLNGTVKIYPDNVLSYVSASLTPVYANSDSVEWNVGTLTPFQAGSFVATFNVSITAPIGSYVNSIVQVEPIINDANTACNVDTSIVEITGSFDPNDILVSEDTLTTTQLASQPFLDYTIRFQNTGNDTAFNIKIINPIDTFKLELSSIEFVNASHPVQLKWVNYNRNMEFLFDNILLPDSNVNEPLSHGFVHYRMKPKTTLLAGDSITNKAYIYFDFNAPVETNTAITRIVLPTGLTPSPSPKERGALLCYPNPAKDNLTLTLSKGEGTAPCQIKIFDVLGKEIFKKQNVLFKNRSYSLSFGEGWGEAGIYFVEVKTGKDVYRAKFVKQ